MTEFSSNGAVITFKKSLRRAMFYHQLRDVLADDESLEDHNERFQYAYICAYVETVEGLNWTPPKLGDSKKAIEASYQTFLDIEDIGYEFFNGLLEAVNAMHAPVSDAVQRPDESLTEEEKSDPN